MIDFLIKSTICLTVFLGFYHLVLEREKIHQFNRFYLLGSIVISLVIPSVTYQIITEIPVYVDAEMEFYPTIIQTEKVVEPIDYFKIISWSLYGLITLLFAIRFGKNAWKLISKTISNPKVKYKNANLILIDEKTLPHTFLNFIYINFEDYNNRNIEDELYTHELVHVTQKHTLDILFIEFLKVIFWFNPIFIFYKKAIQLNHEFLADEEIVKTYNNVPFYQNLLLQKEIGTQTIYLASNLNYLVTKKRLIMMTKSTSQTTAVLKKIAIAPIFAVLVSFLCIETVAQEKIITKQEKTNKPSSEKTINLQSIKTDGTISEKINFKTVDTIKKVKPLEKVTIKGEEYLKIEKQYFNEKGTTDSTATSIEKSGYITINNQTHFYITNEGTTEYYDRWGHRVNAKGEKLNTNSSPIIQQVEKTNNIQTPSTVKSLDEFDPKDKKEGYIYLNNGTLTGTYFFIKNENGEVEYYNRWGNRVNENGEKLTQPEEKK